MQFSFEQNLAIKNNYQHVALIAVAGSGKTTVLIAKIKLLLKMGIDPKEILVITFTNKASKEISLRLKNPLVNVYTFDAFCYNILDQKLNILEKSFEFTNEEILKFNNYDAKNKKQIKPYRYNEYINYKKINNVYDFYDIEKLALNKIKTNNIKYNYILIDEFQDTNNLQYELFKNLCNNKTYTFIVGDPDQSIYKFRGANNKLINKYIKDFNAKLLYLNNNYRSTKNICLLANKVISKNKNRIKKQLTPINLNNGIIKYMFFKNELIEYNYIIQYYEKIKSKYRTIAILYRNNEQGYLYKKYFYNKYDNINILTIHEAKGLEFDCVFLIGVNDKVFPNYNNIVELEEERRLFFVAITRAKKKLIISSAYKVSKFIKENKIDRRW